MSVTGQEKQRSHSCSMWGSSYLQHNRNKCRVRG